MGIHTHVCCSICNVLLHMKIRIQLCGFFAILCENLLSAYVAYRLFYMKIHLKVVWLFSLSYMKVHKQHTMYNVNEVLLSPIQLNLVR